MQGVALLPGSELRFWRASAPPTGRAGWPLISAAAAANRLERAGRRTGTPINPRGMAWSWMSDDRRGGQAPLSTSCPRAVCRHFKLLVNNARVAPGPVPAKARREWTGTMIIPIFHWTEVNVTHALATALIAWGAGASIINIGSNRVWGKSLSCSTSRRQAGLSCSSFPSIFAACDLQGTGWCV